LKSFIEKLRKRSGKNIWLMGGGELARSFLKEDLVDELYIGIVPVPDRRRPSALPQRLSRNASSLCSKTKPSRKA